MVKLLKLMHKPLLFVIGARAVPEFQGGIEKQVELLYPLLKKDFDISIAVMRKYQEVKRWDGVKIKRFLSFPHKKIEKVIYSLWATLYALITKPDIVHVHGIGAGLFLPLLKLRKIKVVLHYRSQDYYYPKWGWLGKNILRIAEIISVKSSDMIIVVSKRFENELKKRYGSVKVIYIPNIVNFSKVKDEGVLTKYGLKKKNYILSVGRITPEKNFELLIMAFKKTNLNKNLVIVGGKDKEDYYEELKKLAYSDKRIVFTGALSRKELNALYSHAYMFILASVFEGTPNVVLEAASFNIPIYLSDIPAHRELNFDPRAYFSNEKELKAILESTPILLYDSYNLLKPYNAKEVSKKISEIFKKLLRDD